MQLRRGRLSGLCRSDLQNIEPLAMVTTRSLVWDPSVSYREVTSSAPSAAAAGDAREANPPEGFVTGYLSSTGEEGRNFVKVNDYNIAIDCREMMVLEAPSFPLQVIRRDMYSNTPTCMWPTKQRNT
ncbi:hypothetical protein N658DRAFT_105040 [Parathielavia hyrcaniae]|uniref:Uncharacterized protein n=1 Tax=Parathielavia hyrcaniae TaxID=113614 RepID=A0AAN6Q3E1_9PEZI|nr:hypothetical protein N658DRAFT_105040 [Parathielavia hyrcaniae]